MNRYKKFLPDTDITIKSFNYLKENNFIYNDSLFYSLIDRDQYFLKVPEALDFFNKLNLTCRAVSLIKIFKNNISIHTDNSPNSGITVRINIPVLNSEYSKTMFYENFNGKHVTKKLPNGSVYFEFLEEDCKEIDSVCIDAPTAINVSIPHRVICQKFPRIALSFHLTPDPKDLLL